MRLELSIKKTEMFSFLKKCDKLLKKKNQSLGGKTSLRHCIKEKPQPQGRQKGPEGWLPRTQSHISLEAVTQRRALFCDTLGSSPGWLAPQLGAQPPH